MALAPVQNTGLRAGPGARHPQLAWEEYIVPSRPTCQQRHRPLCALWRTLAGNTGARAHAVGASAGRANKPPSETLAGKDGTVLRCWGRGGTAPHGHAAVPTQERAEDRVRGLGVPGSCTQPHPCLEGSRAGQCPRLGCREPASR